MRTKEVLQEEMCVCVFFSSITRISVWFFFSLHPVVLLSIPDVTMWQRMLIPRDPVFAQMDINLFVVSFASCMTVVLISLCFPLFLLSHWFVYLSRFPPRRSHFLPSTNSSKTTIRLCSIPCRSISFLSLPSLVWIAFLCSLYARKCLLVFWTTRHTERWT